MPKKVTGAGRPGMPGRERKLGLIVWEIFSIVIGNV
jgi:hypothetical protein